jgi:hypothetical protein
MTESDVLLQEQLIEPVKINYSDQVLLGQAVEDFNGVEAG